MGRKAATKATPEKEATDYAKLVFLTELADAGMVCESAMTAGIDRTTAYRWRERDKEFALWWDQALEMGTEILEREATRRAVRGVTKPIYQGGILVGAQQEYSDTLLIFLLKARKPEAYRDRASIEHLGKGGRELPAPVSVQAGVLVVPGVLQDANAWTQLVQGKSKQ